MNKQMLKWILYQMDEAVLLNWVTATDTKVKGFREISISNFKQLKPQIINELQKQTKRMKLKNIMHRHISKTFTKDELETLRSKEQDELLNLINNNELTLIDVLIVLLTGEKMNQFECAEYIFASILNNVELNKYEKQAELVSDLEGVQVLESVLPNEEETVGKLLEQIMQEKEINNQLNATIEELRRKRKLEIFEWKKERKTYIEEINSLKNDGESHSRIITEKDVQINDLKDEVTQLQENINNILHSNFNQTSEVSIPVEMAENVIYNKPKVILLGESINPSIMNTNKFEVQLITGEGVEDFIQNPIQAKEVWMLTFQITPNKQRKLRSIYHQDNFIEFANINELQTYINKR